MTTLETLLAEYEQQQVEFSHVIRVLESAPCDAVVDARLVERLERAFAAASQQEFNVRGVRA